MDLLLHSLSICGYKTYAKNMYVYADTGIEPT